MVVMVVAIGIVMMMSVVMVRGMLRRTILRVDVRTAIMASRLTSDMHVPERG